MVTANTNQVNLAPTTTCLKIPSHILGHCFSFLGSSGHYYFLASVCKDFRAAVKELYKGNYNTSAESIISSVSTCRHVYRTVQYQIRMKITEAIFRNDRVDVFKDMSQTLTLLCPSNAREAIAQQSTEILRFIITDEEMFLQMKNEISLSKANNNYVPLVILAPSTCDVDMIQHLLQKGIEFKPLSVLQTLLRKSLDTFECLLGIVSFEDFEMAQKCEMIEMALDHEKHIQAIKILRATSIFNNEELLFHAFRHSYRRYNLLVEHIKVLLEDRNDLSNAAFKGLMYFCVMEERLDILKYIHESIQRIDVEYCYRIAEQNNKQEMIPSLLEME